MSKFDRDKNGLECDAVIHLRNGSYTIYEFISDFIPWFSTHG